MTSQIEDYEVLAVIGTGSFGTCYKVKNKLSEKIYVWKAMDYGSMSEEKKQLLVSEVNLLSELNHPHIVRYYDRILHRETTTIYIIMEWCQGGDLSSLIQQHKVAGQCVEEPFVWRVLYQTGRALQACHSHLGDVTVLHRDIKPANVFLDANGNVKLGDFGLARILRGHQTCADTIVGTPYYMSPLVKLLCCPLRLKVAHGTWFRDINMPWQSSKSLESQISLTGNETPADPPDIVSRVFKCKLNEEVIKGDKYNRKSDIWALGCLVYELCALSPPFIGSDLRQLASSIRDGRFEPIPSDYSADLQRVIELMLSVAQQCRPTVEMILHHPTVLLHVSDKHSFHFGNLLNKRDRVKDKCDRATLRLVSEKIQSLSTLDKGPEQVTSDVFQEKWMSRLEALRQRESNMRKREDKLIEKERALLKREKHLSLIERISKEKLARAEVYLRQCKENRPTIPSGVTKTQKYRLVEELDTSFSADPGDTSVLPTSAKLHPDDVLPPSNFVRCASERRYKQVHFDVSKRVRTLPDIHEVPTNILRDIRMNQQAKASRPPSQVIDAEQFKMGAVPKKTVVENKPTAFKPGLLPSNNWDDERKIWLENKRAAYQSVINKENAANEFNKREKEVKKKSSKLSIFSTKQSIR